MKKEKWQINREIYGELKDELKKNQKFNKFNPGKLFILLFILSIPFIALIFMKPHEYIDSFDNIPDPIQTTTSGGIIITVEGQTINIDFLAEYDMKGRVLAIAQYGDNIFERLFNSRFLTDNIIRYRDVGIGWGFMTLDEYVKRFTRRSSGRFLIPEYKSYEDYLYVKSRYSWDDINTHLSHNHLIPANNRIKRLLHGIDKGQYVHIKGYLVRLHGDQGYELTSSLTRTDQGDGACETIYVTDISRLKEK